MLNSIFLEVDLDLGQRARETALQRFILWIFFDEACDAVARTCIR
jgi:hypothetical protein